MGQYKARIASQGNMHKNFLVLPHLLPVSHPVLTQLSPDTPHLAGGQEEPMILNTLIFFFCPQSSYQALQSQQKEGVQFSWKARKGMEFVQLPTIFKLLSKLFLQYYFSVGYHSWRL